jgi:hypothetical protein
MKADGRYDVTDADHRQITSFFHLVTMTASPDRSAKGTDFAVRRH